VQARAVKKTSGIASFYKLSQDERLKLIKDFSGLTDEDVHILKTGTLPFGSAERMIENVVGVFPMPIGIAVNFLVNNRDYLVPMATTDGSSIAIGTR